MQVKVSYKLNEIMFARKISFRQLEINSGVSKSMLNDIANGKTNPRLSTVCKVAAALKVDIGDIVTYEVIER